MERVAIINYKVLAHAIQRPSRRESAQQGELLAGHGAQQVRDARPEAAHLHHQVDARRPRQIVLVPERRTGYAANRVCAHEAATGRDFDGSSGLFDQRPGAGDYGVHDLDAMIRTAELVLLRPPNADWTINVIGLLNPRHPIFSKRYVAPKPVVNRVVHAVEYDNGDEFFRRLA